MAGNLRLSLALRYEIVLGLASHVKVFLNQWMSQIHTHLMMRALFNLFLNFSYFILSASNLREALF